MTSTPTHLTPRARRLAAALEELPMRTVPLEQLWMLYAAADPAGATQASRRADLAATIDALAAAGVLTPSKSRDTTATPALPTRITLPAAAPTETAAVLARAVPWRPELAWVPAARITVGQVSLLQAVNTWLRDRGHDDDTAPLRERSLELFGYEKQLDRMLPTSLFDPGRLTLDLLRTFRTRPPLATRRTGEGSVLLVVENSDTFDTLARVLTLNPGSVGYIAWGAGAAFESSVLSIADLPGVNAVSYFGDLDADGLRFPASASMLAATQGLPPVRPADGLYKLLLAAGVPQRGQPPIDPERAAALSEWLPPAVQNPVTALLSGGTRLAQEAVRATLLSQNTGWRRGLLP